MNTAGERGRMPGVELFASGDHRGKPWSPAEIDAIIRNFRRFSSGPNPLHEVRDGPGHEDDRTDLPAYGRYVRVYKEVQPCRLCRGAGAAGGERCKGCFGTGRRHVLKGDLEDVTPEGMRRLAQGGFDRTSAEIYPDPSYAGLPGGPDDGPMLRRAAALAYEPPQVKGLAKRPPVEKYGEGKTTLIVREVRKSRTGTWLAFSERVPVTGREAMNPDECRKKLVAAGASEADLAGVPDAGLAFMCRLLGDGPTDADLDAADPASMKPDEKAKFGEHCRSRMGKYAEWARKYGEAGPVNALTAQEKKGAPTDADKFSELFKPLLDQAKAEIRREFAGVREQASQLEANTKRANIDRFCEAMLKAGKLLPAELDGGGKLPTIKDRLYRADAKQPVHKFGEGGKEVALTELDLQMREIEGRPALMNYAGRLVKSTPAGAKGVDPAAETIKASFEAFSEKFPKGTTAESLQKGYAAFLKNNPQATVEDFLPDGLLAR